MKAVIFDLDGVLCSTDRYHYLAWKSLADEQNIYFDEQINNRLRGVSRMASLEIVLERSDRSYSGEEKLAMAEKKKEGIEKNDKIAMYEKKLQELLELAKKRRNVLISSKA